MLSTQHRTLAVEVEQAYSGILSTLRRVYQEEGSAALFRGLVPRVLWIGLGGAVFLGTYESFQRLQRGEAAHKI